MFTVMVIHYQNLMYILLGAKLRSSDTVWYVVVGVNLVANDFIIVGIKCCLQDCNMCNHLNIHASIAPNIL